MTRQYYGGPRDGEDVGDIHATAEEIIVSVTEYMDHVPVSTEEHVYRPDSFGRITYWGMTSRKDLRDV